MKAKILITGATGLVGSALQKRLHGLGYELHLLSRQSGTLPPDTFHWDIVKQTIDPKCLEGVESIVHLAGEPLMGKRWTAAQKQRIISSRTDSIALIKKALQQYPHQVKNFISASAVGYYGDGGSTLLHEDMPAGRGFLAHCCESWESAANEMTKLGLRVVKLRTGIVLSKHGGALKSMDKAVKIGLGSALGSGEQIVPWIHIDDLVQMYIFALSQEGLNGAYNANAPYAVNNKRFMQQLAQQLHRPFLPLAVPAFVLKLILGESAEAILMSSNTSAAKIQETGFTFKYPILKDALAQIYAY